MRADRVWSWSCVVGVLVGLCGLVGLGRLVWVWPAGGALLWRVVLPLDSKRWRRAFAAVRLLLVGFGWGGLAWSLCAGWSGSWLCMVVIGHGRSARTLSYTWYPCNPASNLITNGTTTANGLILAQNSLSNKVGEALH